VQSLLFLGPNVQGCKRYPHHLILLLRETGVGRLPIRLFSQLRHSEFRIAISTKYATDNTHVRRNVSIKFVVLNNSGWVSSIERVAYVIRTIFGVKESVC